MSAHPLEVDAPPDTPFLEFRRHVDALPGLVLEAHVEAALVTRWLAPEGMTMTVHRWEPERPGPWAFSHTTPDGTRHDFHGAFHVVPDVHHGLVWTFEHDGAPGQVSLEHVTFEPTPEGTLLRTRAVHSSVAARDAMLDSGMTAGMEECYRALDALMEALLVERRDVMPLDA